jgi:hypothetical protein
MLLVKNNQVPNYNIFSGTCLEIKGVKCFSSSAWSKLTKKKKKMKMVTIIIQKNYKL